MPAPAADRDCEATLAAWQRAYGGGDRSLPETAAGVLPRNLCNRSGGDVLAAWRRWHEPALDSSFSAIEWPWYAIFERARVEILASRHLPGIALNLDDVESILPSSATAARLYRLARDILARGDSGNLGRSDSADALTGVRHALTGARAALTDASAFADRLRALVRELGKGDALDQASPEAQMPSPLTDATEELLERAAPGRSVVEHFEERRTDAGYAVYSRQWDQVAPAGYWNQAADSGPSLLRDAHQHALRRLANRLQRRLLAARMRRWSFDLDQGLLDSRRLARLLIPAADPRVFRRECATPVPEACVVLLVDQSGSMRGRRRQVAALAVDLAVRALELCRVRCEVLGFTTRFGSDNPLMRRWQHAGSPEAPGRLNAVRHVIYKSAPQPWRRARRHLALLVAEHFGHENIDGEALIWASSRLRLQPEPNKVLIVLSDGAPFDAATARANGRTFLENHLRAAVARIEAGPIHLAAIGAGQEVGRYYRNALTVREPAEAAEVLFTHLGDVLTSAPGC